MIEEISPRDFCAARNANELWQLLDVREDWEIRIAAIAGSVNIPMAQVPARHAELNTSRPVAVLCHSGVRSGKVANFLAQQGFQRVANISGGIEAWSLTVDSALPRY